MNEICKDLAEMVADAGITELVNHNTDLTNSELDSLRRVLLDAANKHFLELYEQTKSPKHALIDLDKVVSVYSGKSGCCCCGCSGKHTTASKYRKLNEKRLGYELEDSQINDRTVKMITNKINNAIEAVNADSEDVKVDFDSDGEYVAWDTGSRLYVAYLTK